MLPPFSWSAAATQWQFAPIVTAFTALIAAAYLWGALRVRRRHPRRPWPLHRTFFFLLGLIVIVIATQSGIGTYDDTLFWDHMIQHLMLIMIAPPLLVMGQPVTLLLHASRNPLHNGVKRLVRSRPVQWITWPGFGVIVYTTAVVGTHLTNFFNLVIQYNSVHDAEHVIYLVAGYLYFLPLLGREPIRWKVSYPLRLFLLFIAMPVDAFTGVALGSYRKWPFLPLDPRSWGPSPVEDIHDGGAVMWIGGAAIMFAVIMVVFLQWTRETNSSVSMGWLETARRASMADRIAETNPAGAVGVQSQSAGPMASGAGWDADLDEDEDQLAAYNSYLARINGEHSASHPVSGKDDKSASSE